VVKYSGKWFVRHLAAGAVVLAGMAAFASPAMAQQPARQFLPTVIPAAGSVTTLTASTTNPRPFQRVLFTVNVTCITGSPVGGTVVFTDNGVPEAARPVLGMFGSPTGTATATPFFVFGTHVIRAHFQGAPGCAPSTSNSVTVRVVPAFSFAGGDASAPAAQTWDEDSSEDASSGTAAA
jgi:uncharacterized protein (DUF697 family)